MHSLGRKLGVAGLISTLWAATGCLADLFNRSAGFDSRPLTVATMDLFNQRQPNRQGRRSWKGDWIFRRDRLDLVDKTLRNAKPDMLLLQGVMERSGSGAESDRAILSAGAMSDYDWRYWSIEDYADTQETEAMAVAVVPPAKLRDESGSKPAVWILGTDGYLMATAVEYEDQPITVFNVRMPSSAEHSNIWFAFVKERVAELIRKERRCHRRVIIGGYMPADDGMSGLLDFLQGLQLKDASAGFCQTAAACYTATPANELFMAAMGDDTPRRADRLFVHRSTYVYSSVRTLDEPDLADRFIKEFGLTHLWPSWRMGWVSQLRLGRCTASELDIGS